jgi:hypothetical protein
MAVKLSNNATSTLSAAISPSATQVTVQANDAALFPSLGNGDWFPATLVDANGAMEIVRVTVRNGATMTVQRAQEGTTAKAFSVGAKFDLRLTTAALLDMTVAGLTDFMRVVLTQPNAETVRNTLGVDAKLGFTPIQQGGPKDSTDNKLYVGWGQDLSLKLKIDNTEFGSVWPIKARDNVDKAGDTITGSLAVNGDIITGSRLKVGVGQIASTIEMHDADEGNRSVHNNQGSIGFLNRDGSWAFRAYDDGSVRATANVYAADARLQVDGNVVGSVWSNWGSSDAYNAILTRIEQRALDWANSRVSAFQYRLVSEGTFGVGDTVAPWGACVMGMNIAAGGTVQYYRYRYMQIYDPVRGWVGFFNA